jgi:FixJ family two-component response regulator
MMPKHPVVCVVEDDKAVRNALKFSLEVEGLDVRAYDGAPSLLEDPELPACDCFVVDFRMPAIDGLELVETLRARSITASILMITGRATRDLRVRAGKLDILRVIEKPLLAAALMCAIEAAIGNERTR